MIIINVISNCCVNDNKKGIWIKAPKEREIARKLLTCESRSEEDSVEGVGEAVRIVLILLKETDPEKSPFLANPILSLNSLKPKGHPSSCIITKTTQRIHKKTQKDRENDKIILL